MTQHGRLQKVLGHVELWFSGEPPHHGSGMHYFMKQFQISNAAHSHVVTKRLMIMAKDLGAFLIPAALDRTLNLGATERTVMTHVAQFHSHLDVKRQLITQVGLGWSSNVDGSITALPYCWWRWGCPHLHGKTRRRQA